MATACQYKTKNVCASMINFELEGNVVKNVSFQGGCNGNLKAISKLVEGMTVGLDEVDGIRPDTFMVVQQAHAALDKGGM